MGRIHCASAAASSSPFSRLSGCRASSSPVMTRSVAVQLCTILIVLLAFTTCVAAHPDESSPYDTFDLDMSTTSLLESLGQHLIDPQIMVRMSASCPPEAGVDGRVKAPWNSQMMPPLLSAMPSWQGLDASAYGPEPASSYESLGSVSTAAVDGQAFADNVDEQQICYPPIHQHYGTPPLPINIQQAASYPPRNTTQVPPMAEPGPSGYAPGMGQQASLSMPARLPFYPADPFVNMNGYGTHYAHPAAPAQVHPASFPRFIPQGRAMRPLPEVLLAEEMNANPGAAEYSGVAGWNLESRTCIERVQPNRSLAALDMASLQPPIAGTSNEHSPTSPSSNTSSRLRAPPRKKDQLKQGDHQYVCHQCRARFPTQGGLSRHNKWHEPYDQRQHACNACQLRFRYPKDLKRHKATHEVTTKRHFCPVSDCKYATKGFTRSDHLVRHQRTQHKDRPLTPATASSSSHR